MESFNPGLGMPDTNPNGPRQKIQLFISCRKLKDLDYVGKSDPFWEVHVKNDDRSDWIKVAKTDTVINDLNPDFSTPITIDYFFEKNQYIKFKVYDQDQGSKQSLGMAETSVANLIGAKNQTYMEYLKEKKGKHLIEVVI